MHHTACRLVSEGQYQHHITLQHIISWLILVLNQQSLPCPLLPLWYCRHILVSVIEKGTNKRTSKVKIITSKKILILFLAIESRTAMFVVVWGRGEVWSENVISFASRIYRGGRLVGRWYMPTAAGYVIGIFDILRSSHGMDSNPIQSVMYDFWQYYNL